MYRTGLLMYFSKPDTPAAPDYVGAAKAQGVANAEAARASAKLSNPNIVNPYGTQTVTYGTGSKFNEDAYNKAMTDYQQQLSQWNSQGGKPVSQIDILLAQLMGEPMPTTGSSLKEAPLMPTRAQFTDVGDPDVATVTQSLSPAGQKLFDQQNRISQGLGNLAEGGISRVGQMLGTPFDMSQIQARPDLNNTLSRDAMTKSIIDRNKPMMDQRRQQLETQLSNQGIFRGSDAYKTALDDLGRQENDFNLAAIQAGGQEQSRMYGLESDARNRDIQTQAYLRSLPLNEINALRSGAQVNMPQFQAYQGQSMAAAPIFAGTQAQGQADMARYNAQQAGDSALMGGLFSLGSAALMSPTGTFSKMFGG